MRLGLGRRGGLRLELGRRGLLLVRGVAVVARPAVPHGLAAGAGWGLTKGGRDGDGASLSSAAALGLEKWGTRKTTPNRHHHDVAGDHRNGRGRRFPLCGTRLLPLVQPPPAQPPPSRLRILLAVLHRTRLQRNRCSCARRGAKTGSRAPPAWMMRQAGRYMAEYQALAKRHPSFRERSEKTDLIVEITLQPWRAFAPDGVILFSDILTPLPAIGVPFDISDSKGPVIQSPVRSEEQVRELVPLDLDMLQFVGESLKILRNEVMAVYTFVL
ncbi:hypothetical protein PR202_gb05493 [Eleusine coracana subsp. coracana]|uniref:Uroporphyrinogen decarboxylase (URO-D) domain-containing protein n=1 Tax=Eleusine coracana subsp. coracana TaxID=191504 RepID=A0AAV5E7C1_ELECO|nr:hypothetical protein PR202_gb05493 [Eleusine coracana subsp. coracana]